MANVFMANVENSETNLLKEPNGDKLIVQYKGEARFLRAYYYWTLMKLHGPVILVGDERMPGTAMIFSYHVTPGKNVLIIYWLNLMLARKMVPDRHLTAAGAEDATQTGRINQLVIDAVKSQVLLFDASPLYNGNPDYANYKNADGQAVNKHQL